MTYFIKNLFIWFFLFNTCYCLEISPKQELALEKFLRTTIEKSEFGYVLYDKKPVCIHGYHLIDNFIQENDHHIESVYIKEGVSILKELGLTSLDENIIIHVYNGEDSLVKNYVHVLFINRKLFIETVEKNIALFQYVLGPNITPHSLLKQLVDPNQRFHSVLKNDKVLIGILLGFGTQNSLYVGRLENIEDSFFAAVHPPFKSAFANLEQTNPLQSYLLLQESVDNKQNFPLTPSIGYSSLQEEASAISQKLTVSSEKLSRNSPAFIFGRLKDDSNTDTLVAELESVQDKIGDLLQKQSFFEIVMRMVYPSERIQKNSVLSTIIPNERNEISKIVASSIYDAMSDLNIPDYILGLKSAEIGAVNKYEGADDLKYRRLKALTRIKSNLSDTDQFFDELDTSFYNCVQPSKLYIKIIKDGKGNPLKDQTNVLIHYTIKTSKKGLIADTLAGGEPVKVNLSDTICGFAHGIKGMKIGEIREIYIHPSLAYGIYTPFEKGVYLKAQVQLLDVDDLSKQEFPKLTSFNLKSEFYPNMENDYAEESQKIAHSQGYKIWEHYKKSNDYSLKEIISFIEELQNGKEYDIKSEQKQKILNTLHWEIYSL